MSLAKFPVFPLKTICFPGHKLQLKIFEDRYVQMLKDIEANPHFVIALISSGEEVGQDLGKEATPYRIGSLVEIENTQRRGDFIFIRVRGMHRVNLESFDRTSKPYLMSTCSEYKDEFSPGASTEHPHSRIPELEAKILNMVTVLGPEESRGIREVLEDLRFELDAENYSLFLCGCVDLPPIYLQRLLESRSLSYRIDNALNLLSQRQ